MEKTRNSAIRTYKRKLILTKEQRVRIDAWMGCCRLVYNMGMEIKNAHYRATSKSIHKYELMKQITALRKEYEFIKDVPSDTLNSMMDRLDDSYKAFFRTMKHGGGFPKFMSKKSKETILFKYVYVRNGDIILPKIGLVKTFKDRDILGTPKSAQIVKCSSGYFVCIQCDGVPVRANSDNQTVGIDVGITHFYVSSDGEFVANPRFRKNTDRKFNIASRSLNRKVKGSNSWKKQLANLSRVHQKISNTRLDFLHKQSSILAKTYSTVYVENLNFSNMAKNTNLSKHILDCGWGLFRKMLEYKTRVIRVNARFTSQTCFTCGSISAENRKTQSEFICTTCLYEENADLNAAKNIKKAGALLGIVKVSH